MIAKLAKSSFQAIQSKRRAKGCVNSNVHYLLKDLYAGYDLVTVFNHTEF